MHLDRATLDAWVAKQDGHDRRFVVRLDSGDSIRTVYDSIIAGPALVELVTLRDSGWTVRLLPHQTPASIMLEVGLGSGV